MKKWFKRISLGILILVLVTVLGTFATFMYRRAQHNHELQEHSVLMQTSRGPIEYAELGQGIPVLLVHGTPGGYDQLFDTIKATNKEGNGHRYIMPSRPGYLRTPLSVGATPEEQAQALAELLTKLGIQKTVVIAVSGGGPAGLQFVLQNPDRCAALVLEEAVTQRWIMPGGSPEASLFRDYMFWLFGRFKIAELQATNPTDRDISILGQNMLNSMQPSNLRIDGEMNDGKQAAVMQSWPLQQIHCPTLILHGTADVNVTIANSELAHAQIANSEFVKFAGEDHFMPITKRKEIDEAIDEFLAKHELQ